ncbi:MAG: hypothetical protein SVO26_07385 [Chloroflexota bacterium]|nr:hypothetical protein [Chloroflexota bacterium]
MYWNGIYGSIEQESDIGNEVQEWLSEAYWLAHDKGTRKKCSAAPLIDEMERDANSLATS